MGHDFYKQAQEAAKEELLELRRQKVEIEKRIARLQQSILSLDALISDETDEQESASGLGIVGITDACRNALKVARSPRTAIEVRDWLEQSGYDLRDQANALASIHTILKRLVDSDEARPVGKDGKFAYEWVGSIDRPHWGMSLAKVFQNSQPDDKAVIDPFVGQGSTPSKVDAVVTNPPYRVPKTDTPGKGKRKIIQRSLDLEMKGK